MQSAGKTSFISALTGGAIVAAVFAILLVTGVVDGKERTIVQQSAGAPAGSNGDSDGLKTVNQIYKKAGPGVVLIQARVASTSQSPFGPQRQEGLASGSGVVVDDRGYIVTNAHVVEGATGEVRVKFSDDLTVDAKVIGTDPSNDLAVLKVGVDKKKLHPVPLGDSSKLEVGSPVIAIGNPFGLDRTVTTGIVSALQRHITAPNNFTINNVIQTDAAINPGNSGGPLLDSQGSVIGINSQIATAGGNEGNVGIGFAVPIDTVKRVLPQLEQDGKIDYAYLGVTTQSLTPEIAGRLNFGGAKAGALVQCVVRGGPGAKAGLTAGGDVATINGEEFPLDGDLITGIGEHKIQGADDVSAAVTDKKPGDKIKIDVVRDGKKRSVSVKLGKRPTNSARNNCSR